MKLMLRRDFTAILFALYPGGDIEERVGSANIMTCSFPSAAGRRCMVSCGDIFFCGRRPGRVSYPKAALSGHNPKAPGSAGGYLLLPVRDI